MPDREHLKRSITLPLLTLYGLGTILGAGIYVLTGEVAAHSGLYAPIAFMLASLLAAFSAFSYAELSARFPVSAGEAVYVQRAFGNQQLSRIIGILVIAIGIVSSATLANGFVGYLQIFVDIPAWLVITLLIAALGGLAAWGISESAWIAALATLVEIIGLLMILWSGGDKLLTLPEHLPSLIPPLEIVAWFGITSGAFVAFYAFIGFEDIVNVAEEVKNPTTTVPLAILISLAVATLLYMLVTTVAVLTVPPAELGESSAPLAHVYQQASGKSPLFISLIGLAAVLNGALVQIIMASRVLYGMSNQKWIHGWFGSIHPGTKTPLHATTFIAIIILILALWLPLSTLAKTTSLITLIVFSLINLSLWRIKRKDPEPVGIRTYPLWIPTTGFFASIGMVIAQILIWL